MSIARIAALEDRVLALEQGRATMESAELTALVLRIQRAVQALRAGSALKVDFQWRDSIVDILEGKA